MEIEKQTRDSGSACILVAPLLSPTPKKDYPTGRKSNGNLMGYTGFHINCLARLYFGFLFHPPPGCLRLRLLGRFINRLTKV